MPKAVSPSDILNETSSDSVEDVDLTPGEKLIVLKLEEIFEQLAELAEKIHDINLASEEGFSID